MKSKIDILESIEENRQKYIDAALDIWDYSEPIFEEHKSSRRLARLLEEEGFRITFGVAALPTAFTAEWGGGEPVIGYMGEYDALPDLSQEADSLEKKPVPGRTCGHGCGHHLLGTAAAAAAIANKKYLEDNGMSGTVRFYGCPAEEGGGGKVIMNNEGLFDDCLAAISWHPTDDNGIWSINFHSQQTVDYTFCGGEESSSLDALKLFLAGASMLRNHLPSYYVVRSSVLKTGDADMENLPKESVVRYAYRTHTNAQVREAMSALHDVARGAALMTGCTLKAEYKTGYSELLPNRSLERIMYDQYRIVGTVPMTDEDWKYAKRMHTALPEDCETPTFDLMHLLYEEQADSIIEQVKGKPYNNVLYPFREINVHKPGSTDICDVSWNTPTVQCVVACYIKDTLGHSWQEVAQGRNAIPMKGMLVAAKVMGLTGIELCANEEARKAVCEEFSKARAGKTYIPLTARKLTEKDRYENE